MASAPGSPTAIGIVVGTLGQLSTPELLAKRLQRQQAEREAAAAAHARPSMRRTLQPTQHQNVPQHAAAGSQQSKMLGRSFRRPAEQQQQQQQPPAAAAEPTGVSSDALARLLEAEAPADEEPSKRIRLTALCSSSSQQQQPSTANDAGSSSPLLKVCLLTNRQADTSLGAAQQRLASIQEQKQQEAQAAAAAAAAMAEQARREREQSSAQAASDAAHSSRWRYQPDEPGQADEPQQQQHQQQQQQQHSQQQHQQQQQQHQRQQQQQAAHGRPAGHQVFHQQPEEPPGQQPEEQKVEQQPEQQQRGQQEEQQPPRQQPCASRSSRVLPLSFSAAGAPSNPAAGAAASAAAAPGSPPAAAAADAVAGPDSDPGGGEEQTLQAMMQQRQKQRQRKPAQQQERGGRAGRAPGSRGPAAKPEQDSSSDEEETLAAREVRLQQQQQQPKQQRVRRQRRCRSAAANPAGADSDGRDDQTLASLLEAKRQQQQQQRQPKRQRKGSSRTGAETGAAALAASGAAAPASRRKRPAAAASKQRLPRGLVSLAAAVDAARQGSKRLQQLQVAAAAGGPSPSAVLPPSSTRRPPAAQRQQQQQQPPGLLQARAPAAAGQSCLPPELLRHLTGTGPAGPAAAAGDAAAGGAAAGRVVLLDDADDDVLLDILPPAAAAAAAAAGSGAAVWRAPQDAVAAAAAERLQDSAGQSSEQEDEEEEEGSGWDSGSSSDGWQDEAGQYSSSSEECDVAAMAAAAAADGDGASGRDCDMAAGSDGGGSSASDGGGRRKASRASKAAAGSSRKGKGTAAGSRKARTAAAGAAPAATRKRRKAADAADAGAADPAAAAAAKKPRRTKAAAAGAGTAAAAGGGRKKPLKTTHRNNFRRTKTGANGYGTFKFMSKSGVAGGSRPFRRVVNGRLIRGRRRAPHMAGQGAEFVDGFAAGGTTGKGRCFKCGQAGHWEQQCPLLVAKVAAQEAEMAAFISLQQEEQQQQGEQGSTQRQAAAAAAGGDGAQQAAAAAPAAAAPQGYPQHRQQQQQQALEPPPEPLTQAQLCELAGVDPAAPWQPAALTDGQLLAVLTGVWGHASFRGQQLPLIRAALESSSMLGVLPTGLGKSLTYQMPALLLQGLVVVVSPLLALMRDQVGRLPRGLPGAMLQGNMPRHEVEQVLARAEAGGLRVLYVAPEKLTAPLVMATLQRLSPLPLVCVDEAHCMAEWGQGFRPAYFRLGHLLCNVLRPRAVLALTATATPATRACVRQLLSIPLEQQVVASPLRDNLRLQVLHCQAGAGKGGGIAAKITQMITTGELAGEASVVVYVSYKASADALAGQLQRATVAARPYHAGMSMANREAVQAAFLSGTIRVVVATVAFGMGLDNPNLGAVLHASLPHSLEEYVQQVGRAGRDGRVARCFLFLDDAEYLRLRALAHSGLAEQHQVEAFLASVFGRQTQQQPQQAPAAAAGDKRKRVQPVLPPSRHRALPITATANELDLSSEVMEACLSFLQADPLEPLLTALPNCSATLDVRFHKTPPEQLAGNHQVVAAILAAKCRKYNGTYKVHLPALLAAADRPPGELLAELAGLAGQQEVGLDMGSDKVLAWRLERQPQDWQALVAQLTARLAQVQRAAVLRLDRCYAALASAAIYGGQQQQEAHLRGVIEAYFSEGAAEEAAGLGLGGEAAAALGGPAPDDAQQQQQQAAPAGGSDDEGGGEEGAGAMPWGGSDPVQRPPRAVLQRRVRAALHGIAARARDLGPGVFGGLALARFLAGLSSPRLPASTWKGCAEWGRLDAVDFSLLLAAARGAVQEFWDGEAQQKQQKEQQRRALPAGG